MATFQGEVTADVCETRFAFSGLVASVAKRAGDTLKRGEIIASLDRKLLQTELDRQLADYEKVRAEFEIFQKKAPKEDDDIAKYTREARQATLSVSVKEVELAKYRLDQADLKSPVNGNVVEMSGLTAGLFVTSSSNPVLVVNRESLRFSFTIGQENIGQFLSSVKVRVRIHHTGKETGGMTIPIAIGKDGNFEVLVNLDDTSNFIPGMKGEVSV